ncbi:methyl-accepting chemotaxis protein [Desulfosediminicola flagellatus]|uniref:methyl-accepting chemotaxis protein n=1 Tax=Desulfosediminicola flagellatus TaxID=2569541 RepID=UPI0010AC7E49|nr:methyl-accepting chemotaxis protein [Desulfosediminicola flagellatus]
MRFKDISINKKLLSGFGVILLLLLTISTVSWTRFNSAIQDITTVKVANELNETLLKREIDLQMFFATVNKFFLDTNTATIAIETDPTKCEPGKWLYGEERKNIEKHFPALSPIISAIEQPHKDLHASIKEINALAATQNKVDILDEAKAIYGTKSKEALKTIQDNLHTISKEVAQLTASTDFHVNSNITAGKNLLITLSLLSLGIGVLFSLVITRNISKTTQHLATLTADLANGNMRVQSHLEQNDEMGQLACSANNLASNLNNMCTRVHGAASTINASSNSQVGLSASLHNLAEDMAANCNTVAAAAEEMNTNMAAIAAASEETSVNVSMVAAATEEMTSTITEISSNSENARVITEQAVNEATKASISVKELGVAAEKINKVTETINEIADQTNLLALNATIEAARAGEAGKGFAVVANEIKDLARQTTEATREIQERIEGVQSSSEQTINVIGTIGKIINSTSEIVSSMAAAVEEQAVTSNEIAENISQASAGMQEVTENISQASAVNSDVARDIALLKSEADKVAAASSDVKELAVEMQNNTESLSVMLDNFSFKQPQFDIGTIKDAHFNWKMRLTSVLSGYTTINASEIPNHHQCAFGKWYDDAPPELSSLDIFKEIGIHHEAVHQNVVEAVNLYNDNNSSAATRKVEEFEKVRKSLFKALDDLYALPDTHVTKI